MAAIGNITVQDLQEFYPITDSLSQEKINALTNFVKNNTFLAMFGLSISKKIFDGTIPDSANDDFMGFKKLVALCIAAQQVEEVFIHTNAGLKIVGQPQWSTPKVSEKNLTLLKINATVENQFIEAKKILLSEGLKPENKYAPYSSFKVTRV